MVLRRVFYKQPVAGSVSWNNPDDMRGNLECVIVNPSDTTTIYDFSLTDDTGTVVYNKDGLQGVFVDESKLGLYGIHTCIIENTSASNKSFTVTLIWNEDLK